MQIGNIHERLKILSTKNIDEIYHYLQVNQYNINEHDVNELRQKYGSNQNDTRKKDSILYCIQRAFINPFSIILFILGIISFITDVLLTKGIHRSLTSTMIIFIMLVISGTVRLIQELKSKQISEELTRLVSTTIKVRRNHHIVEVSSTELVVGDYVYLKAGDRSPADIRITKAEDLFVSQAIITGESAILEKDANTLINKPEHLADYTNILFSNTTITGGKGEGIVLAVGHDTLYGGLNITQLDRKHRFDQGANSIAWVLIRFMIILVPIVFIASGITQDDWLEAFIFALSVAVGLTPELLPMVVNACLARGSYLMGHKQTVVKNINAMQSFGSMDILCVDKTGTLTGDTILLEYYMDILGNECQKTLDYAYLASYYHTGIGNHLDVAITNIATLPGQKEYYEQLTKKYPKYDEKPFDHSRRYSSIILKEDDHYLMIVKGSIDEILDQCSHFEYRGKITAMDTHPQDSVHHIVDEMLEDGMKIIAIAYKNIKKDEDIHESDLILLGYLAFFDSPKTSSISAIHKLKNQNVNIKVLTGDHSLVASSICKRLKIDHDHIITGQKLEKISDNDLPIIIEKGNIFCELSPKQKAMIIETLQSNGHTVGYLGDGMNDLPAIIQADVGISVENATEALKESADVILLKKDLNVLEEGIIEGRKAFINMSKYIKITASSNFGNIIAVVIASVLLPFYPMTSIQLLMLNLLYDILCLVLPWDHVDEDMLSKPLEFSGKKLPRFMLFFGPLSSVFDLITFAFLFFILCPNILGNSFSQLSAIDQERFIVLFQSGWFLESMWTQILILQSLRTKKLPFIQSRPGKMVVFVSMIGIILFTTLPMTPIGNMIGLCMMPPLYYLFLIVIVVMYLLLVTFMKYIYVRKVHSLI